MSSRTGTGAAGQRPGRRAAPGGLGDLLEAVIETRVGLQAGAVIKRLVIGPQGTTEEFSPIATVQPKSAQRRRVIGRLPAFNYLRHLLAFVFAIEEINKNPKLLPNITLGFQVYDTCSIDTGSVDGLLRILSGTQNPVTKYSCYKRGQVAAIIGHMLSSSSVVMAQVASIHRYPQISYGAMDLVLSDRLQFPSFYRVVPDERYEQDAIVQLLLHFGWRWVGLIASVEDSSQRASKVLREKLTKEGICLEYLITCSGTSLDSYQEAVKAIQSSSSTVVVVYSSLMYFGPLMYSEGWSSLANKVWIVSLTMDIFTETNIYWGVFNGSLMMSFPRGEIPGLKEFLFTATPALYPSNPFLRDLWVSEFGCSGSNCLGKKYLQTVGLSLYDVNNFHVTYNVYKSVYVVAHALHNMYQMGEFTSVSSLKKNFHPWKVTQALTEKTLEHIPCEPFSCLLGYVKPVQPMNRRLVAVALLPAERWVAIDWGMKT
ncbi:hypothetical protein NDU88_000165 [Pleurodeles waltl]|uniref:Receptor ligand binding region domain-containing protein n=1 Tax=Pleurodeles waltl TaxID=8319 RepID=A0AAV7WEP0_PLEWA|nr:hypothetical protein NDU88_000165 [Pleurodeles waltl]